MSAHNYGFVTPTRLNSRNDDVKQDVDLITVRLNYKFGGPVVARYGSLA